MTVARTLFAALALALTALIVWAMGADGRGLGHVLADMVRAPWTLVTLADLYLGFLISAAVILIFEKNRAAGLFWALPVFVLGNVWTGLWLALRLPALLRRLRPAA